MYSPPWDAGAGSASNAQQKASVRPTYRPQSIPYLSSARRPCCGAPSAAVAAVAAASDAVSTLDNAPPSRRGDQDWLPIRDTRKTWTGLDVTSPEDRKSVARSTRQDVVVGGRGWSPALIRVRSRCIIRIVCVVKPDINGGHNRRRFESFGQPRFYAAVHATPA